MKKQEILYFIKEILLKNHLTLSCAESCTGGLVSSYLTDVAGASEFIFQNFVTYSNLAKEKFLNVKRETLDNFGAVSSETASEMAQGLLQYSDVSVATTGILGPSGGSEKKPVGLVYIGLGAKNNNIKVVKYISKKSLEPASKEFNPIKKRHKIKKDIARRAIFELLLYLKEIT